MNTIQLTNILNTETNSLGVFPCDKLPKKATNNTCFIANTEASGQPGQHWVCFYNDERGVCSYFDSYGKSPHHNAYFKKYLKTASTVTWNNNRFQSNLSSCCGQYCVFYITLRNRNYSHSQIVAHFDENLDENDYFVTKWVNKNFNMSLPTLDLDYVMTQISKSLA